MHDLSIHRGHSAVALLALVLGGCSSFGSRAEPPPPDPNLFPAQYKTEVADFMRTYLSNPTKVRDAFISQPVLKPFGGTPHYISCVRYNPQGQQESVHGKPE